MIDRQTFRQRLRWRASWRLEDAPLLFVDLETTGLHPERGHRIVEAAIFDAGGLRYHDECFASGERADESDRAIVVETTRAIANKVVVGHNIPFDLQFLAERCQRLGLPMPALGFIDTLGMARRFLLDSDEELTLEYVARCLELNIPHQLHRAAPDARLARDVFNALSELDELETLSDARVRRFEVYVH